MTDTTTNLSAAFAHCQQLLGTDPALAKEQALAILEAVPHHPQAVLYVGIAQRRVGEVAAALATLTALAHTQPNSADVAFELGLALIDGDQSDAALSELTRATVLRPHFGEAWRVLGDLHMLAQHLKEAKARRIPAKCTNLNHGIRHASA